MYFRNITQVTGSLLIVLAFFFLGPAILAIYYGEDYVAFLESFAATLFFGFCLKTFSGKTENNFSTKEGFAIVIVCWILLAIFGSFPFLLMELQSESNKLSFVDSFFEMMSGLTTTGASVIPEIEKLPKSLILWRSLTHWLGGMGIIVLFLAVLPILGAGGFQLFRAEIPGPSKERLSPRIGNTAKMLWSIYLFLTLAQFTSLQAAGMDWFDSICHTFGTVATGGFSTKNQSIMSYNNARFEWIIIVFMYLAGCNFILFLQIQKGNWQSFLKSSEWKLYTFIIIFTTFIFTALHFIHIEKVDRDIFESLRLSAFQVISIITSTGYATADYNHWPLLSKLVILILMFIGACSGSTGGGMKIFRFLIIFKVGFREIYQLLRPRAILPIKVDGENLEDRLIRVILGFICLYFICFGIGATIVVWLEESSKVSLIALLSICISCLSNIGPGLGEFGPLDNYSSLKEPTKLVLSFMMLLGRLEIYSVLVCFHPDFWKR